MALRSTSLGSFHWIKQPDYNGGLQYHAKKTFEASGAGSTTTIVSSGLAPTADDDYVGYLVMCVKATNTQNVSQDLHRITACTNGTNTLTVDAFPAATADGDTFHLMTPSHALAVADSTASSTNLVIPTRDRDEADDFWNGTTEMGGPRVVVVAADNASATNHMLVTDFTNAGQDVKIGTALAGAVAIGDYFELWKDVELKGNVIPELTLELVDRKPMAGKYGKASSRAAARMASYSSEHPFRGPGTGREGLTSEQHDPLSCVFDVASSGGNSTVDTGSTTTSVTYSAGNHSVNDLLLTEEGYAAIVTADSGSAYTVTPALGTAPVSTTTAYGCSTYTPTNNGINGAMSLMGYHGKDCQSIFWGCVPNVKLSAAKGDLITIAYDWNIADGARFGHIGSETTRGFLPTLASTDPSVAGVSRLVVDGTELDVKSFSFDTGLSIVPKANVNAPNNHGGFQVVDHDPTGQLDVYYDTSERKALADFFSGKEVELLFQAGSAPGDPGVIVLYCAKIRYTGAPPADDSGIVSMSCTFQVASVPDGAQPDFALGIF